MIAATPAGPSAPGPGAPAGLVAQARSKMALGAKLIAEAVGMLKDHVNSDEGRAALAALKALAPVIPDIEEGIGQSEIQALLASQSAARPAASANPTGMPFPRPRPQVMSGGPLGANSMRA